MRYRRLQTLRPIATLTFIGVLASLVAPDTGHASEIVEDGYDLFETNSGGTLFLGQNWEGVRLGTYDFGDGNGPVDVGTTDTIVRRLDVVPAGSPANSTRLQLEALQLKSVNAFDPDGSGTLPEDFYYIVAKPKNEQDIGSMGIDFGPEPHGTVPSTASSSLPVAFELRQGSLNGPAIPLALLGQQDNVTLTGATVWSHTPRFGAILIDDINHRLAPDNSTDRDFFAEFEEVHPEGAMHSVRQARLASVPEPGTMMLMGLGLAGLVSTRRRKKNIQ